MFEFVDNQVVRIILEIVMALFTGIIGFFSGINYSNKKNNIKTIKNSIVNGISQVNK